MLLPIILSGFFLFVFYGFVARKAERRYKAENQMIREKGYLSLFGDEPPTSSIAKARNETRHLRQAYFDMKRKSLLLEHDQRLLQYDQRDVQMEQKKNLLTIQEIEVAKGHIEIELKQQRIEIEGLLRSIEYSKKDLELSTREQSLFISEQKFEFLETAFQKTVQFEKARIELARKEFGLAQRDAFQQLKEYGFILRGKELTLEAKQHGLVLKEGELSLREQRFDNDATFRERSLILRTDAYRNEMQQRENKLFLSLGKLKNEKRSVDIERRSWQLREEWKEVIEEGRNEVESLHRWKEGLLKQITLLLKDRRHLQE